MWETEKYSGVFHTVADKRIKVEKKSVQVLILTQGKWTVKSEGD